MGRATTCLDCWFVVGDGLSKGAAARVPGHLFYVRVYMYQAVRSITMSTEYSRLPTPVYQNY